MTIQFKDKRPKPGEVLDKMAAAMQPYKPREAPTAKPVVKRKGNKVEVGFKAEF